MSANMRFNDIISIIIDEFTDIEEVKEYFNEVGREI
jgi:hypothetical protein